MKSNSVISEIEQLKAIKEKWTRTRIGKSNAHSLLREITVFNHTIKVDFPNAAKFYTNNSETEIYITDGIEEMEQYANSKLVRKDDQYFYRGIRNLESGLNLLIHKLTLIENN